jgi:hypothetical protein
MPKQSAVRARKKQYRSESMERDQGHFSHRIFVAGRRNRILHRESFLRREEDLRVSAP